MLWRSIDPSGHSDVLYTLAAILVYAWLLAVIGVFDAGFAANVLLAAAVVMIAIALLRHPV